MTGITVAYTVLVYLRCFHSKGVVGILQSNLFLEIVHALHILKHVPHERVENIDSVYSITVNVLTILKFMACVLPSVCKAQVIDSKW